MRWIFIWHFEVSIYYKNLFSMICMLTFDPKINQYYLQSKNYGSYFIHLSFLYFICNIILTYYHLKFWFSILPFIRMSCFVHETLSNGQHVQETFLFQLISLFFHEMYRFRLHPDQNINHLPYLNHRRQWCDWRFSCPHHRFRSG